MKILHVFSFFSIEHGGATVDLVYKIMKALHAKGHEVTLYTSDYELDQDFLNSLSPVEFKVVHSVFSRSGFHVLPSLVRVVRDNIKDFDIIHLHSQRSLLHLAVCYYAVKYGIPYVIDSHGSAPILSKVLLKYIHDKTIGKYIYSHCSQFIAENRLGENEYINLGIVSPRITIITPPRDRITIINPPMEIEAFSQLPKGDLFKKNYNLPDKKIVMFLGRINKIKGICYLVDGFYELLKKRSDIILVISGADDGDMGNIKKKVKSLGISDFVFFTGYISGVVKLSGLVAADVVVQPSVYEQGAWCPLEVLLCGTPVIVSSHTGAGIDIKDMDGGYLIDIYNPVDIAEKIDFVLNNKSEAMAKANKGAEYIKRNLSLTTSVAKYEAMYKKCLLSKIER